MAVSVFASELEWDNGNWPKCEKHGVSRAEIEEVLSAELMISADPYPHERRVRAVGKTVAGRYVFIVFTERERQGELRLRPISARYMHKKEIENYEQRTEKISCFSQ